MEQVNKMVEKENLKTRFTSLFELYRISIDSRQDLDKLKQKVRVNQQEQKETKEEKKDLDNKWN